MSGRSNRQILTKGKNYANKQARKFGAAEVTFDKDSRLDYLTGFHKRKVERQKNAREFNKEQDRLTRVEARKKMRDARKEEMEEQMRKFKEGLELEAEIQEEINNSLTGKKPVESDEDSWNGFSDDDKEDTDSGEVKPILKPNQVSAAVYEDDTTVEVESLEPNENFEYLAKINNVKLESSEKVLDQSITRAKKYATFLGMAENEDDDGKKKKKKQKKFRYLTKNERKDNQRKACKNKHRKN